MNPADVIPAPKIESITPIIGCNTVKQTAIVAPQSKIVFDEMQQYEQLTNTKNQLEIVQMNKGIKDTPTKRKIQVVKKLPVVNEHNVMTKLTKPIVTTSSTTTTTTSVATPATNDTILSAGTPFVINKANGNISGKN